MLFFECEAYFSDQNNSLLIAFSTIAVAAFTFTLWRAITEQGSITERLLRLSRDEFIASHRPKIILRDVVLDGRSINYTLVNIGGTKASIQESRITTELIGPKGPLTASRSSGFHDIIDVLFECGEVKEIKFRMSDNYGFFIAYPETRHITTEDEPAYRDHILYFVGALLYSDERGVKRRSVFRRQWNDASESFVRVDDPDQEYAD